jgi:hypothetical protein
MPCPRNSGSVIVGLQAVNSPAAAVCRPTLRSCAVEHVREWSLLVYLEEQENHTSARAVLKTGDNEVTGLGLARRRPGDTDVPEIGDELATARALSDLAHKLFDAAIGDIEQATHHAVASVAGQQS